MKMLNKSWKTKINKIFYISIFLLSISGCRFPTFLNQENNLEQFNSKIITTNNITDILKFADNNTLVVFDIDQTLLKEYLLNKDNEQIYFNSSLYELMDNFITEYNLNKIIFNLKIIKTPEITQKIKVYLHPLVNTQMIKLWNILEPKIKYSVTEKEVPELLNSLHKKNIKTIALTAREWKVCNSTHQELKSTGININTIPIYDKEILIKPENGKYGYGYKNGIIFLIRGKDFNKKTQKGRVLLNFFKKIKYFPEKIIFIDDRNDNIQDVFNYLLSKNKSIIGINYKYKNLDENIRIKPTEIETLNKYLGNKWWKLNINYDQLHNKF